MTRPLMRVAVVGAGQASAPHLLALNELRDQVALAWVVARTPQRLAALALPPGTRPTTELQDVLQDRSVEAALVLTPPNSHLDIAQQLAQAGKHVLVEKPLDTTLPRAQALVQACEHHGVKLAVMLQHRMRAASQALARLVADGTLGSLTGASASIRWWRPQSYYDEPGRGTLARDGGGVLMTQAIHTLDLLMSLTGLPAQVTALTATSPVHQMECEDTVTAMLRYPNGALGSIDATTAAWPGFNERIALNCTLGSATLEAGELTVNMHDGSTTRVGEKQATGSGANLMAFDHGPHRAVLEDFVSAIRARREPAVSGRSALAVHRLIDAMVASQGRPVSLV
ncbi:MAG: Gfo/Idh/MocA family protein [Ramlibacter sp.]